MWSGTTNNEAAFLDMLAISEGTDQIGQNHGYDVIVGSTAALPDLFTDYSDHPRKLVWIPRLKKDSTAAGRYQLLSGYFDVYKRLLPVPDFGPDSQDRIALQQIKERYARQAVQDGNLFTAISACASCWASLPGSTAGQGTNSLSFLKAAYLAAGGIIST